MGTAGYINIAAVLFCSFSARDSGGNMLEILRDAQLHVRVVAGVLPPSLFGLSVGSGANLSGWRRGVRGDTALHYLLALGDFMNPV